MLAGMTSQYADLSKENLIRTLERQDARRALGLVWERERIIQEAAHNSRKRRGDTISPEVVGGV